jgi:CheY-like chemotaxis protein
VPEFFAWLERPGPGEASSTSVAPLGTENVLLVDSDPTLRRHGGLFLQSLGYNIQVCIDGFDALNSVLRIHRRLDLLFTAVSMPKMDGRVLAARVRTLLPAVKVLFTSATRKDALFPVRDGHEAIRFLPKPYAASELAELVRKILDE